MPGVTIWLVLLTAHATLVLMETESTASLVSVDFLRWPMSRLWNKTAEEAKKSFMCVWGVWRRLYRHFVDLYFRLFLFVETGKGVAKVNREGKSFSKGLQQINFQYNLTF